MNNNFQLWKMVSIVSERAALRAGMLIVGSPLSFTCFRNSDIVSEECINNVNVLPAKAIGEWNRQGFTFMVRQTHLYHCVCQPKFISYDCLQLNFSSFARAKQMPLNIHSLALQIRLSLVTTNCLLIVRMKA